MKLVCVALFCMTLSTSVTQPSSSLPYEPRDKIQGPQPFSQHDSTDDKCVVLFEAKLNPDELINELKLADFLKKVDGSIKSLLEEDGSPGGAVLSLVYRDRIVWTGGYGLKNMSGVLPGIRLSSLEQINALVLHPM